MTVSVEAVQIRQEETFTIKDLISLPRGPVVKDINLSSISTALHRDIAQGRNIRFKSGFDGDNDAGKVCCYPLLDVDEDGGQRLVRIDYQGELACFVMTNGKEARWSLIAIDKPIYTQMIEFVQRTYIDFVSNEEEYLITDTASLENILPPALFKTFVTSKAAS
jgi:hypothetical protein